MHVSPGGPNSPETLGILPTSFVGCSNNSAGHFGHSGVERTNFAQANPANLLSGKEGSRKSMLDSGRDQVRSDSFPMSGRAGSQESVLDSSLDLAGSSSAVSSQSIPHVAVSRRSMLDPSAVAVSDSTGNTIASQQTAVTHVAESGVNCIHDYLSCFNALKDAAWPSRAGPDRLCTSALSGNSGYWSFGVQISNRGSLTLVSKELPKLCHDLNAFLCQLFPGESWNSLCVSRNILTSPHRDTANAPGSYNLTVGIGSYTSGGLWVEDSEGSVQQYIPQLSEQIRGKIVNTHHAPLKFPSQLWHCTQPWLGDRWILTAYTLPDIAHETIAMLGFPRAAAESPEVVLVVPSSSSITNSSSNCEKTAALSQSSVNWGKASLHGFANHSLKVQPQIPRSPHNTATPPLPESPGHRIFLDICSGLEKPLSAAIEALGFSTLAIDVLLDKSMDLLNNEFYEQLLFLRVRGCWLLRCISLLFGVFPLEIVGGPTVCHSHPTTVGRGLWSFARGPSTHSGKP